VCPAIRSPEPHNVVGLRRVTPLVGHLASLDLLLELMVLAALALF